jgi:hypothetical protein
MAKWRPNEIDKLQLHEKLSVPEKQWRGQGPQESEKLTFPS